MSRQKNVYVFIGPPGAGKGSLSQYCTVHLGWTQLSTGNLCRKNIAEKTKIGMEIDFALKSGKLVSDTLITDMVGQWFDQQISNSNISAIILDGFPRTVPQAEALQDLLQEKLSFLKLNVVRLSLSDDVIITRLGSRYICANKECQAVYSVLPNSAMAPKNMGKCDKCSGSLLRREDDQKESVKERLVMYHKHEKALLDFYKKAGRSVIDVAVDKPLEKVFDEFKKLIDVNDS